MPQTTDELVEELLRMLPERYQASRAVLASVAAQLAKISNVAELDFIPQSTFGDSSGPFLTLIARGYGIFRSTGEGDAALLTRLRNIEDALTVDSITDAVDALLAPRTAVPSVLIEHWTAPLVLDTDDLDHAFILDNSSFYDAHNAFTLIIPDFGDDTDPIYASVISEVERLRGAGVRWFLILEGAP